MSQSAPEGWNSDHDRWLVRSVCDLGWFTSMQKKRAAVIQEVISGDTLDHTVAFPV